MGALTAITPTNAGTASTGTAAAASDTINVSQMGPVGCYLEVINAGGSTDNITISDDGATPSGNALSGGTYSGSVANGASKVFLIKRDQALDSTGNVTITHSFTTSVTEKVYPH